MESADPEDPGIVRLRQGVDVWEAVKTSQAQLPWETSE